MSDLKISQLTAIGTLNGAQLLPIIDDPSGSPITKKVTLTQLQSFLGLTLGASNNIFGSNGTVNAWEAAMGTGSPVRATNATLTTPSIAKLANLTSNGFVKTGGGDGTLSVDTAGYLPLAGGTLSGVVLLPNGSASNPSIAFASATGQGLYSDVTGSVAIRSSNVITSFADGVSLRSNSATLRIGASDDTVLARDAANVFAQRNGAAAPQTYRIYETYTDASNYSRLSISCPTGGPITFTSESAGTGTVRTFSFNQTLACSGSVTVGSHLQFSGANSRITGVSAGIIEMVNTSTGTGFDRLQFGGGTTSFPALKRSTTELQCRLADDSGFASFQALYKRVGSGTPEGSVTAPIGATYHRTDGGAGTSFYVKESGASNTGWIAK